jgi:hypothetical protein
MLDVLESQCWDESSLMEQPQGARACRSVLSASALHGCFHNTWVDILII